MTRDVFITRGNIEILNQKKAALFTSKDTPAEIYAHIDALFGKLKNMDMAVCGGWQAPFERKLYKNIALNDKANYIYYLAKDINLLKLTTKEEAMVSSGKLLFIAPNIKGSRISAPLVTARDELLFAQNNKIVFFYISKGGRLEKYFRQLNPQQFQLFILDHPLNKNFITADVIALNEDNITALLNM